MARPIDRPTDSPSIVHRERQASTEPCGGGPATAQATAQPDATAQADAALAHLVDQFLEVAVSQNPVSKN